MKYAAVLVTLAAGAFAVPQAASSITAAPSAAVPTGLPPTVSCALACPSGDVNCQAACLGNARPNASQAIATNECAAKCDQGDGSPSASQNYAKCVDSCINSLFPSSQTVNVPGAAAASSAAASAASSGASMATGSRSGSAASPTGSAASAAASPSNAAEAKSVHLAGAGFAGLLALLAL